MKNVLRTASILALATGSAHAGGIDRSGQGIGALFEKGNYVEFSFGMVNPTVEGTDVASFATQDVAGNYLSYGFAYKADINDQLSYAIILDQPFGADIAWPTAAAGGSVMLGGTIAKTTETALTALLRYKFTDRFSVHGGVRGQYASGEITLDGLAYGGPPPGGFSGYNVTLDGDMGLGFTGGVAYEIPDIALRVALTYNSKVKHELDTIERVGAVQIAPQSVTEVNTPQSVNLDFQTGIAQGTLLFGQIRWVDWSDFRIDPAAFTVAAGGGLVELEDSTTYTLGVGRKFNDTWSGAFSVSYEEKSDPLVSPLAPTNGRLGMTLAAVYTQDNVKITTGINYTKLGDAQPETGTPDVARAYMTGNNAVGVGVRIGYSF